MRITEEALGSERPCGPALIPLSQTSFRMTVLEYLCKWHISKAAGARWGARRCYAPQRRGQAQSAGGERGGGVAAPSPGFPGQEAGAAPTCKPGLRLNTSPTRRRSRGNGPDVTSLARACPLNNESGWTPSFTGVHTFARIPQYFKYYGRSGE